ncbi:MAG: undecaprenyl/decaprenyl-phosphate alpha-N-acetylglucosaminyl 1-phosphate transferase [Acidobacteria bacterium]|nr:undecaprenyl/decaprenyl-phosphate alpha-N-acetylglucosaminyl 1-phosphate transferase [Acidobacteriota bacterium]
MRSYLTLFTLSFIISLLITPVVRRKAIAWGAMAIPDSGRHIHPRPTPRLGGVAIYIAFVVTLLCVPFLGNLVSESFRANIPKLTALLLPATLILCFGIYDDFRGASAPVKLVIQAIASVMVYFSGLQIDNLSSPFGGTWELPILLSFPLTALWIILITNAFNLIDGIDGLAAGASVFALLSILVFSVAQGNIEISLISIVLVGAVIGFLRYNFNPATIFLGDSGSLFLGFMAAALSLSGSQKGSTIVAIAIPLVSFGLPLTEAGVSLVRRFLSGQSVLIGDRGHIHHKLLQRGLTQRQAVILLYAICALFSLFGLMLLNPERDIGALIFFILGVVIIFGVQHLRYAEFSELGSQIKREVVRRRRSLAVNVRVRRTSDYLSDAKTPDQFFAALDEMLATNEFNCATLELSMNPAIFESYLTHFPDYRANIDTRKVIWVWEDGQTDPEELISSNRCWTIRLPLTNEQGKTLGSMTFYRCLSDGTPSIDINNLCGNLQRELSAALARLTGSGVRP